MLAARNLVTYSCTLIEHRVDSTVFLHHIHVAMELK